MEPRFISDYSPGITEASKSVLIELMTILGSYQGSLVLIGGWVPYFLLEEHKPKNVDFTHVGSADIDLVIDPKVIDDKKYRTITELLLDHDYSPSEKVLYQFERKLLSPRDKSKYTIGIDFLTPQPPKGKGISRRHRQIQPDLKARNLPGAEVVIESNITIPLEGRLPENGKTKIEFKMANLASFLALKGIAFGERYKEKDAYDVSSICEYYKEGPNSVSAEVKPHINNQIILKGLKAIRNRFRDVDSDGPSWVVNFKEIIDPEEKEEVKLRCFMVVDETLRKSGI